LAKFVQRNFEKFEDQNFAKFRLEFSKILYFTEKGQAAICCESVRRGEVEGKVGRKERGREGRRGGREGRMIGREG
jgi:hypothetical protein